MFINLTPRLFICLSYNYLLFIALTLNFFVVLLCFRFEAALPFTSVSKVITVSEGYDGGIRLDVTLPLARPYPIDTNRISDINIPLFTNREDAVKLIFPPNGAFYENGSRFDGNATVWITTWSTDNEEDAETVPGDFLAAPDDQRRDEAERSLFTQGVLCLVVTDDQNQLINLADGCEIVIDQDALPPFDLGDPILWGLNSGNGLWEFNSQLESQRNLQRNTLTGPIRLFPNIRDFNIDWRFDSCFVRVKVFQNSDFDDAEQLAGVRVKIGVSIEGRRGWIFFASVITSEDGACARVLCCRSFRCQRIKLRLTIKAETEDGTLNPANHELGHMTGLSPPLIYDLDYTIKEPQQISSLIEGSAMGPAFSTFEQCSDSEGFHFRFYKDLVNRKYPYVYGHVQEKSPVDVAPNKRRIIILLNGDLAGMVDQHGFYNVTLGMDGLRFVLR